MLTIMRGNSLAPSLHPSQLNHHNPLDCVALSTFQSFECNFYFKVMRKENNDKLGKMHAISTQVCPRECMCTEQKILKLRISSKQLKQARGIANLLHLICISGWNYDYNFCCGEFVLAGRIFPMFFLRFIYSSLTIIAHFLIKLTAIIFKCLRRVMPDGNKHITSGFQEEHNPILFAPFLQVFGLSLLRAIFSGCFSHILFTDVCRHYHPLYRVFIIQGHYKIL